MPQLTAHEAVAKVLGCDLATAAELIADLAQEGYFLWPEVLIERASEMKEIRRLVAESKRYASEAREDVEVLRDQIEEVRRGD